MSCPDDTRLLLLCMGELSTNEANELEPHVAGCTRCRQVQQAHQQLLSDLRAAPPLTDSAAAFTERVMSACPEQLVEPTPVARRFRTLRWAGIAAAAACLSFALLRGPSRPDVAELTARGASDHAEVAFAEVLFERERVFYPVAGARLRAGDGLAVRCTNRSQRPINLAVFALDAAGDVHWIYPRYLDAASNPASVLVGAHVRDQLLDEVVEPEQPAPGALRIFALLGKRAVHVKEVEEQLPRLASAAPSEIWPDTHVQQWSATWTR